jgi:hypothetical protein
LLGESSCSDIFGRCKREPGEEGGDLSTDARNKVKGSELVDENRDIIDGWTDAEKSIISGICKSWTDGSYDRKTIKCLADTRDKESTCNFERVVRKGSTRW